MTKAAFWPKVVAQMHLLLDLFHKIYNVPGLIRIGGLAAMAAVVFAETGLLVGFFLPGDSLLVTAGVFCTSPTTGEAPLLNIVTLNLALIVAAIVGDTVGYWIGAKTGPRIFTREQSLLFSRKHLLRTKAFYERHGGKTIIMARFMPFLRTFAPVVAGVGQMSYRRFLSFNIVGGISWVVSMTLLGFSLGKIHPQITKEIDKVVIVIIFVLVDPGRGELPPESQKDAAHGVARRLMGAKPAAKPKAGASAKVAFPKKAQPPSHAEFAARLPAAVGKRFEAVRGYLKKQEIAEDLYYYGPRTGWAYRYQRGETSLCSS